jgi:hypothetical protein
MSSTVKTYTIGKVMQLIPLNEGNEQFNLDFYIKAETDFHFAVVDQTQLDEGALLDFKQSNAGEVSGNIKNNDNKSFYIALKSLNKSTDLTVSLAHRPIERPPPPPQQQQQRPPPQQQQQRPPPQQQQRPPPQQQQRRPPQQQQRRPPQQQQRRPPQQQQRRPPQQQQRRPPQKPAPRKQKSPPKPNNKQVLNKSGKTYIGVVCAVVVLLIGGGAVWYFCIRKDTTEDKNKKNKKVVDARPALPGGGDLNMRRLEAARRERLATKKYDLLIKRYQREQAAAKKCKMEPVVKPTTKTENASLLKKISKLKG